MKKPSTVTGSALAVIAFIGFALVEYFTDNPRDFFTSNDHPPSAAPSATQAEIDESHLREVIAQQKSGTMVMGTGRVIKVLADDLQGSAHQRFIIELVSGQTLLIAHNIDLAPRLPNLVEGHSVTFKGQYEANDRGGVIHWTHKDPQGRHEGGWLDYQGTRYQ